MLRLGLMPPRGEKVSMKGRTIPVSETASDCLPRVRDRLIEAAHAGEAVLASIVVNA